MLLDPLYFLILTPQCTEFLNLNASHVWEVMQHSWRLIDYFQARIDFSVSFCRLPADEGWEAQTQHFHYQGSTVDHCGGAHVLCGDTWREVSPRYPHVCSSYSPVSLILIENGAHDREEWIEAIHSIAEQLQVLEESNVPDSEEMMDDPRNSKKKKVVCRLSSFTC